MTATSKAGCFIRIAHSITARVMLRNLSDDFVKDIAFSFPPGKLVAGRVMSANADNRRIDASLKLSDVAGAAGDGEEIKWTWGTIQEGAVIVWRPKRVETFGVFVNLSNSARLTGLCHISQASDEYVKDLTTVFSVGDKVQLW